MQIYIAEGSQQTGPFDLDTVKAGLSAGKYTPTQLCWYEGAPGWEPINKLPGLQALVAPVPPPPPVPPAPYPYTPAAPAGSYPPGTPPGAYYPPPPSFVPPTPSTAFGPGSAPTKKGVWTTVGGILLGLLAVVGGIARIVRPFTHGSSYSSSPSTPYSSSSNGTTVPKTTYTNRADLFADGERQKYWVNFRFDYPSSWEIASGAKTASAADFVELNRAYQGYYVESFTVEDFYTNQVSLAADLPTLGPKFMASVDANRPKKATNYQRISEGPTTFRGYTAYEYRAQWVSPNDAGKSRNVFLRYLIVAPPTGKYGVILEMSGDAFSPDIKGLDDLGTKGEMATILDSFTFR